MLNQLTVLCAFARTGTVGAAAREMHYSRAHAGRLLKAVEERVGVPLRVSTPTGSQITRAGVEVVAWSCAVVCGASQVESGRRPVGAGRPGCIAGSTLPCVGVGPCPGRAISECGVEVPEG